MPWNIDKRLFKFELPFEKRKIGEPLFLINDRDQEMKLRQSAE